VKLVLLRACNIASETSRVIQGMAISAASEFDEPAPFWFEKGIEILTV
jgi:hypothetical protein